MLWLFSSSVGEGGNIYLKISVPLAQSPVCSSTAVWKQTAFSAHYRVQRIVRIMRGRCGIFLAEEAALMARLHTVLLDENRHYQTVMGNLLHEGMAV